jgi:hypothetical protein
LGTPTSVLHSKKHGSGWKHKILKNETCIFELNRVPVLHDLRPLAQTLMKYIHLYHPPLYLPWLHAQEQEGSSQEPTSAEPRIDQQQQQ